MNEEPLRSLGRQIASWQDEALRERGVAAEVARRATEAAARRSRRPRASVLLVAAAIIGAIAFLGFGRDASVRPTPSPAVWTAETGDLAEVFPDGTTTLLRAGGRARLVSATDQGGRVALLDGRLHVSVPPGRGSRWTFECGPHQVLVTGTRFDLAWDPGEGRFEIDMLDGSVRVRSDDGSERSVVAGERLRIPADPSPAPADDAPSVPSESGPPTPTASGPTERRPAPPRTAPSSETPRDQPADGGTRWQALALEGRYAEAMQTIGAAGFESALATSTAAELLLLGDAARFAGEAGRSARAYEAVRARYAGGPEAERALFSLGVLAFPEPRAADLFAAYLQAAPGGPLAPEALGRWMEVRDRAGDREGARELARRYLAQHPTGGHAALARSLLDHAP